MLPFLFPVITIFIPHIETIGSAKLLIFIIFEFWLFVSEGFQLIIKTLLHAFFCRYVFQLFIPVICQCAAFRLVRGFQDIIELDDRLVGVFTVFTRHSVECRNGATQFHKRCLNGSHSGFGKRGYGVDLVKKLGCNKRFAFDFPGVSGILRRALARLDAHIRVRPYLRRAVDGA